MCSSSCRSRSRARQRDALATGRHRRRTCKSSFARRARYLAATNSRGTNSRGTPAQFPRCVLPALVLEHRELAKLKTSFLTSLHEKAVRVADGPSVPSTADVAERGASTWRVYPQWCALATGTGRIAARNPNVQQLPKTESAVRLADGSTLTARDALTY